MLRVCEKLRVVDAKSKRHGLARMETDYLRALQDAMANMDRCVEMEVLKSLGDVNLEKGQLDKNPEKFDRAMVLYRTALIRCNDADVGESLRYRYQYAEKLPLGKQSNGSSSFELLSNHRKMTSPVNVAQRLRDLERRFTASFVSGKSLSLLIEYTRLMVEGIVNGDNMLEVEAIKSLGDVYLKRGTETKDTTCLTKAIALYNTALARCERFQGTVALIHRLLYTARIRQRKRTGKKILKHRVQQGQQGHVSRDLPITSTNTDVRDVKGHQSMSYVEYLTTGDRALTDGKLDVAELNFASALREIHNPSKPDQGKEAECLSRLGDVYVQRSETTKEGRKFTQAAALYNAAMARMDKSKHRVTKRLQQVENSFLHHTANVETKHVPPDLAIGHKKRLQEMRTRAKSQLEAIDQQHNPYQYDEDDPVIITVEAERAEAVKALFKNIAKDRQGFIQDLIDECIAILGPPPCKYAVIGLGSQATELVTPYSDLEFAILIEEGKDNADTRRYFINLTHYLHLKVINLGETILPAMAIPSLNDFLSEDPKKTWFFDSVTPRGFSFDGFMPWASKTPFGRNQTKRKPPVSLIQTPVEMAKFQELDVSVAEGYHLSDILRRVVFLTGEEALVETYMVKLIEVVTDGVLSPPLSLLSVWQILNENREQLNSLEPTGQLLNVKKDIYRFPGIAIEVLALCCQITLASAWDIIDRLKETERIEEENATHLTVLTSISAELRLRTYLNNGGQQDSMSPLTQMKYNSKVQEISDTTLSSIFHITDIKILFRYYCRAIPLKKCIPDSLQVQPKGVLKATIFDTSNECRGRISKELFLYDRAKHHLEAALEDIGEDINKRAEISEELGSFLNDITKGISLNEEALRLRKSIYGENTAHPNIAASLHNLGASWNALGDHKKAISYYEQSLTMLKTIYGESTAHPLITASLNNIGVSWKSLGDHRKAICYFEQSLSMKKTIYGENTAHPDIAGSLNNLGWSCSAVGDRKKAFRFYEQSLLMNKTIYGENTAHPDIARSLNNLGASWRSLGDHKKAISYYEQSLLMKKTIYGENTAHPDIAGSLNNLGLSCGDLGDHKKAVHYHEQALSMMKSIYGEHTAHSNIAMPLNNLGSSWSHLSQHKKAISYYEKSLLMMKTIYGENTAHPDIATSLNNLGSSWSDLGDHKKAIDCYKQSLSMRKTIYGENTAHVDIAVSLNNLGTSWSDLGDHKKGINYYEQALSIMKTISGENKAHPDIAKSLNNLGSSWRALGDHKKAILYDEQSLSMRKNIYGENKAHPDIAMSLNNLGSSWSDLGDYKKAISYHEQSLSMRKTIYGESTAHPDIAVSLNNLGASWDNLGDHKNAIRHYEQSLSMAKTIYGENTAHPDIVKSLNNLGASWNDLGDHKKAISYYEQSLSMRKTIYGENTPHPDIAASLSNLGVSWMNLGDYKKSIRYYEQSLAMRKTIYGENTARPDIAKSLNNLGASWYDLGDHKKAIRYYEQSLSMEKTINGEDTAHPDIAKSLNNLGASWSHLGDHKKATRYYEQSLSMRKTIYGENTAHPDIAKSLNNLGASWNHLGDHKKAISYFEQSLSMRKTIYGKNTAHLDIAKSLNNLGVSWNDLGDHKKATRYYEQSLSMMKTIYGENTAHLDIAKSLKNLGASWSNLGNHKKAIRYCEQSLSMMKTIYGENTAHLNIALSLNNLGSSWGKLGDFEEAIRYFELSLSMNKTVYGETKAHPDIALSLLNLGLSWGNLSNHKKAIIYFEQSLTMYRIIYGNNSKNLRISETLKSLHLAWANLGNVKKALEYKQQLQEC